MDDQTILNKLSPIIRRAMYHKACRMVLKPRIIFDYELLYLLKGNLKVFIDGKEYMLTPGSMVLFKPGKCHEFVLLGNDEAHMPHVHFDAEFYDDYKAVPINFKLREQCSHEELGLIRPDILSESLNFPDVLSIDNHKEVLKLLLDIIGYSERGDADSILLQRALMLNILYLIQTGLKAKNDTLFFKNSRNLELSSRYIIEHYNEKIYIDQLSKIACLSTYHFERLFKKSYGISPQGFQMRYRIEKSKELIKFTSMSLGSIAEKVGYADIHSFNKAFKRLVGIPPSKYRDNF
jgi:AraC-like DNA-binding protein